MGVFLRCLTWGVVFSMLPCFSSVQAGIRIDVRGQGYALLIGISEYDDKSVCSLQYPDSDVQELAKALIAGGYLPGNVVAMHGKAEDPKLRPTAENIRKQLKRVSLLSAETVVLAISGHSLSIPDTDGLFLFPVDGTPEAKTRMIAQTELYNALAKSNAKVRLVLWDAARQETKPIACPRGIHVLYGCQEGQQAHEHPGLRHGLFSFFLIHALSGAADFDHDGTITLPELELFTTRRVSEYGDSRGMAQVPDRVSNGSSLGPIVTLPWAGAKNAPVK